MMTPATQTSAKGELVRYEAARAALVAAKNFDEVKDIHDKAEAVRSYARMCRDREMECDAAEIRIRAERRLGEMLRDARSNGLFSGGGRPTISNRQSKILLNDLGVDRKLSARSQRLAQSPERTFERLVNGWRERILSDKTARITVGLSDPPRPRGGPVIKPSADIFSNTTLLDGQEIGEVRVGSLRRRAEAAMLEFKLLSTLANHLGAADHGLSIREAVSAKILHSLIAQSKKT